MEKKQYHLAIVLPKGGCNFVYNAFTRDEAISKARAEFPNAVEITVTLPKNDL